MKCAKDDRRTAILKIAEDAFLSEGYAATSMSAIAARVGGSKATLYNHFASKDELFRAVVQERCNEVGALLAREAQEGGDLKTTLRHLGEAFVTLILSDRFVASYRMMIAESARFPDLGQAFYESGPAQSMFGVATFFRQEMAAGRLIEDDTLAMAKCFLHLCLADVQQRRLLNARPQPTADDIKANVKRAVTMFMATYAKSEVDEGALIRQAAAFTGP